AEYLAGLYLTDLYSNHSPSWSQFIVDAEQKPGSSTTIQGFLLAVRECYLAKIPGATETDIVPEDLYHLATSGSIPNPPQAAPVS
ncbi:MAG: hypothetical protein F6K32_19795, partial [Desertifilum sp. SIO1I2]|nr:hypothetical protein [Desertifilum sp. SIO1I2]